MPNIEYSYSIMPYNQIGLQFEADARTGEVVEKWNDGERVVCKVPISLFRNGSRLIWHERHVVLWHEEGQILHLDFSNTPHVI